MALEQWRLEDLSLNYFIQNLFSGTFVTILDSFPEDDLVLPTVAIDMADIDTSPFELGNRVRMKYRMWYIDVFAINKEQRNDMGMRVLNALEETVPVYNYNEGFPPIIPSRIGGLVPDDITFIPIKILPELTTKMYYRCQIIYKAHFNML